MDEREQGSSAGCAQETRCQGWEEQALTSDATEAGLHGSTQYTARPATQACGAGCSLMPLGQRLLIRPLLQRLEDPLRNKPGRRIRANSINKLNRAPEPHSMKKGLKSMMEQQEGPELG